MAKAPYRMVDYLLSYKSYPAPAPHRMMDSVVKFGLMIQEDPKLKEDVDIQKVFNKFFERCDKARLGLVSAIGTGDEVSIALPKPPPPPYKMMEHIIDVMPFLKKNQKEIIPIYEKLENAESEFLDAESEFLDEMKQRGFELDSEELAKLKE